MLLSINQCEKLKIKYNLKKNFKYDSVKRFIFINNPIHLSI